MTDAKPADIIAFWKAAGPDKWWKHDPAFDEDIRERFGATHAEAAGGALDAWAETAEGALALILVLDQFSRNLFRNDARAWAQDEHARRIANAALASGFDMTVEPELRTFFYMPFEHSELLADQDRSVALFGQSGQEEIRKYADMHRDIIVRFGRFPHRNAMLGRATTLEEQAFLDDGGFAG